MSDLDGSAVFWSAGVLVLGFVVGWLSERRRGATGLRAARQDFDATLANLQAELNDCQRKSRRLSDELDREQAHARDLETRLMLATAALPNEEPEEEAVEKTMAFLRPSVVLPALVPGNAAEPREAVDGHDDLKLIKGIGPVLEKLLNDHGVASFRQIAAWSDEEVRAWNTKLNVFQGRIERDDWRGGARDEHLKKYGVEP